MKNKLFSDISSTDYHQVSSLLTLTRLKMIAENNSPLKDYIDDIEDAIISKTK